MSKKCVKCDIECDSDAADNVCCVECSEVQHVKCAGLKKPTRNRQFKCGKCQDSASISSMSDNEESAVIKAINNLRTDFTKTLNEKLTRMEDKINDSVSSKINELEIRIGAWQGSLNTSINEIKSENATLRKNYDAIKVRCDDLTQQVSVLTDHIQDLQQYSRIDNLEVVGIPVTANEDVYAVLKAVANVIGTPWRREDVSVAHRLSKGRQAHPNIVIRFTSRTVKFAWLLAARKLRLSADMIHNGFPKTPVFINEHLAAHVKATLSRSKQLVKERKLAFAWVKEGKILVKKTADGRAIRVWSIADVEAAAVARQDNGDTTGHGGSS